MSNNSNSYDERHAALIALAVFILIFLIGAAVHSANNTQKNKRSYASRSYTSASSTSARSTSSSSSGIPECPPVNRTPAMTREEAERLKGTGYHGCRPNSSAEQTELKAAQITCKNCGYHSDNGLNSLCDYCAWMERYGGGLPEAENTKGSASTSQKKKKKSSGSSSSAKDPYDAKSYSDPEDFYYDYYDDFIDFEDAESYWEDHR